MGAVRDEFERELAEWRQRYAGQPRREMIQLFLLALEREELVSVGYRETAIIRRLQTMPLTDEIRELIRHALLWCGRTKKSTRFTFAASSSSWEVCACGCKRC